jgi:hypothetical protein
MYCGLTLVRRNHPVTSDQWPRYREPECVMSLNLRCPFITQSVSLSCEGSNVFLQFAPGLHMTVCDCWVLSVVCDCWVLSVVCDCWVLSVALDLVMKCKPLYLHLISAAVAPRLSKPHILKLKPWGKLRFNRDLLEHSSEYFISTFQIRMNCVRRKKYKDQ